MTTKIAVLGSNSFSGADFIDLLLENPDYEVIGLSRSVERDELFLSYQRHVNPKFRFYQIDLNFDLEPLKKILNEFQPDYIVNFAAQSEVAPSWENPWHWFETNAVSLSHLVNYLKDLKSLKRYVHISSPEIYGTCVGTIREDAPFHPSTPYAVSKAAADFLLFSYFKNFNFPLAVVRSTNVYGAGQQLFKIIPRSVISIRSGQRIKLHGGGQAVKSYIHIRDISRGELSVMLSGRNGEIYHLSPDEGVAVREVVEKICRRMGADFDQAVVAVEERLGQDKAYVIDSTKARKELGWSPKVTLDEGLEEVIQWIEGSWERIHQLPHEYIHKA